MVPRIIALPARLWHEYGQKLMRFAGVSVVNVITGQTLLVILYGHLGWSGMAANAVAVACYARSMCRLKGRAQMTLCALNFFTAWLTK